MAVPHDELSRRVRTLLRQRSSLRAMAGDFALHFYRTRRRLPAGYVLALLTTAKVRRIRLRGEIEQMLGIARFLDRMEKRKHGFW